MKVPNSELIHLAWAQLWQVTVLIMAVGILVRLACRNRPHLAHVLWMLVLLKCLTPPLWSSPTGVFSWTQLLLGSLGGESRSSMSPQPAATLVQREPGDGGVSGNAGSSKVPGGRSGRRGQAPASGCRDAHATLAFVADSEVLGR